MKHLDACNFTRLQRVQSDDRTDDSHLDACNFTRLQRRNII